MRLFILVHVMLIYLLSLQQAHADEMPEETPPAPNVAEALWDAHAKSLDLDGDGRITWEEYQKVTSGFAQLDANGDGAITKDELGPTAPPSHTSFGPGALHALHGQPQQVLQNTFTLPPEGDAEGLARLLPLLLGLAAQSEHGGGYGHYGAFGVPGHHGFPGLHGIPGPHGFGGAHGAPYGYGLRFHPGMRGGFGQGPWTGVRQGGRNACGCNGCGGSAGGGDARMLMQLLPLLLQGRQGAASPTAPPASRSMVVQGTPHVTTRTLASVFPEGMKGIAAFGMIASKADQDDDQAITREEWDAAIRAITKDDGTLDLSSLRKNVQVHGMPMPGGGDSFFATLLDADGNGKIEPADLEGVFESLDKNGDGKVEKTEMMPKGMGGIVTPSAR